MSRAASNRLLWGAVKKLAFGEDELRAAVRAMNTRDGTNLAVADKEDFSSTKLMTDRQLTELAEDFRQRANLPAPSRMASGPKGGRARRPDEGAWSVAYIASKGERHYAEYLLTLLGFSEETKAAFIARQTKGADLTTHAGCNAVIAPLESMARRRGWTIVEKNRIKQVQCPSAGAGRTP